MSTAPERADNVLQLPGARESTAERWAVRTAGEVRKHLSLLQGYADLMEGLSAEQSVRILRVMADKIRELTVSLRPFLESQMDVPRLDDYRDARVRTRQLLADYRVLLERLRDNVSTAQANLPPNPDPSTRP